MNELTTEKTMTIREVAEVFGVSYDTINNCIKRIMPNKLKHGKTTYLNEVEVSEISKELKNNSSVIAHQTVEVTSTVKNTTTDLEILNNAMVALADLKRLYDRKEAEYKATIETSFNLADGTQKINLKTVVFQKGVDFIRKMIEVGK